MVILYSCPGDLSSSAMFNFKKLSSSGLGGFLVLCALGRHVGFL